MSNDNVLLGREELLQAYRTMRTIREFEERVHAEFATGDLPGSSISMPERKPPPAGS